MDWLPEEARPGNESRMQFLMSLFLLRSDLYFSFSFLVEMAKRVAGKLYLSVFVLFRDFFFINFIRLSYHKITSMQNNNNK